MLRKCKACGYERDVTIVPACCPQCRAEGFTHNLTIECQNHTIQEVADLLEANSAVIISSERSRNRLARWLRELAVSRDAVYNARVALADIERAEEKEMKKGL